MSEVELAIDFASFERRYDRRDIDLEAAERLWDQRAAEVNEFQSSAQDTVLKRIQANMELTGKRVLDISFGAGRHLEQFLRLGAQVSGVEISAQMCDYARARLDKTGLPWSAGQLIHAPWEAIDLDALQWRGYFDLVFVYMSPALSDTAMVRKALEASRHGVYIALSSYREDSLLTELQAELGLPARRVGQQSAEDPYLLFNILYGWGYFPQLWFDAQHKDNSYTPDYVLNRYAGWLWRDPAERTRQRPLLAQQLAAKTDTKGLIHSQSRSITGHLWLDKTIGRPVQR